MILLKSILNEIETGGTAMSIKTPSPAIMWMYNTGRINNNILDYGAGHGRNANFLKSKGLKVYAYDPYNGSGINGYDGVSNVLPKDKFDVAFTCFVLNVVSDSLEDEIINKVNGYAGTVFHVVRNMDVLVMIKKSIERRDKKVVDSFISYGGNIDNHTANDLLQFAKHGTDTSKGFQRIPESENKGFNLLKSTSAYKVYSK